MKPRFARRAAVLSVCALVMAPATTLAVCTTVSTSQSRPIVTAFLNRPVGVLERFPYGGQDLSDRLSVILQSDVKGTLPSVLEILRSSNHTQKEAIGKALGSTNANCLRRGDSRSAELVQVAIARMTDSVVRAQYFAISAGVTDPDNRKPLEGTAPPSGGGGGLPIGRLPNPFSPQTRADPHRPIQPIR